MLYSATAEQDRKVVKAVAAIASERRIPRAQVALALLLGKPGITAPIAGAMKPKHLEDAIEALGVVLTDDEIKRLEEPYVPHAVTGVNLPNPFEGKVKVLPGS